ncbi:uncharacterized protein TAFA5 [Pipra filicauda]|uniref:Uncharacterized protein TAFA5 n=1 Tax=Pipra filicauda TaxID=649802 RepID=A0A7R5K5Z9_9PASS|nr:uncharacterized protein TAFA5 [Pipra filicauda]
MAPSPRRSSRKDANTLPSMSSTFWAIMILASLLIAYCNFNSYFGADNPQWLYMRHCPGCFQDAFELALAGGCLMEAVTLWKACPGPVNPTREAQAGAGVSGINSLSGAISETSLTVPCPLHDLTDQSQCLLPV